MARLTNLEPDGATRRKRTRGDVPEKVDVAIVGCGLGGLTAGAYLADRGFKVALFDPHYVAGGCTTQFARGSGAERYHFDIGLHYIGDCGPRGMIPTLLRGVDIELDYAPLDPDGFDTLVFPDFTFKIPVAMELYRSRLLDLFPSERKGIDRYIQLLRQVDRISRRVDANKGRLSLAIKLAAITRNWFLVRYGNATIETFLRSCTRDPKLIAVLLGQNGDYGLPPSEVSAVLHAGLAVHYFRGAYYPKGGGQIISDRLADRIEALGGSIHLKCGIERILVEQGRAVGVRTEPRRGEAFEVRADTVVSNADLKRTLLELLGREHLDRRWAARVDSFEMAGAIFMTFLGVKADMAARGMRATNYWQFDDYDFERFYADQRARKMVEPKGCYITSASLKDPETALHHAPEGITNVEIMSLVPGEADFWNVERDPAAIAKWRYKREDAYKALKQRIEDDMVRRFDGLFPGSAADIVYRESATPVTHTRYTRASGGTGYGLAATPSQFMERRPGYRGPISAMYLCGASTRAGHGIVGAMNSGYLAAQRVAADLGKPLAK